MRREAYTYEEKVNLLIKYMKNHPHDVWGMGKEGAEGLREELLSFRDRNRADAPDIACFQNEVIFVRPDCDHPIVGTQTPAGPCFPVLLVDKKTGAAGYSHVDDLTDLENLEGFCKKIRKERGFGDDDSIIQAHLWGGWDDYESEKRLNKMKGILRKQGDVEIVTDNTLGDYFYSSVSVGYNAATKEIISNYTPNNIGPNGLDRYFQSVFTGTEFSIWLFGPTEKRHLNCGYDGFEEVRNRRAQLGEKAFRKRFTQKFHLWAEEHEWARDHLAQGKPILPENKSGKRALAALAESQGQAANSKATTAEIESILKAVLPSKKKGKKTKLPKGLPAAVKEHITDMVDRGKKVDVSALRKAVATAIQRAPDGVSGFKERYGVESVVSDSSVLKEELAVKT